MKKRPFFCFPLFVFVCYFFCLTPGNVFAQQAAGITKVKITVSIEELGYQDIKDKKKFRSVWKFYHGATTNEDSALTNYKRESCFLLKSRKNNKSKELANERDELKPFIADLSGFNITMETFVNKKGGEKCIADQKDAHYGITKVLIPLDKLAMNVWSDEYKIADNFGWFYAAIKYKYELLSGLDAIEFSGNELVKDANKDVVLNLPIKLANKETLPFVWKYATGDNENWRSISNTGKDNAVISLNPLKDIFEGKLNSPEKVKFKAEVSMDNKTETSDILTLTFAPAPPVFNKEKDMILLPVCNSLANGGIDIKNIKASASQIKYVLRKKAEAAEPCNFKDTIIDECPGFVKAGSISANSTLKIRNLAAGEYIIYIFNSDLESGIVNTATLFTISELPPVAFIDTDLAPKDPTCNNDKGGEIYMNVAGGADLWQIAIVPDKGKMTWDGNNISFKNLEAGKYTVYLSDQCGHEISKTFNLKKAKQISIDKETITSKQDKADFFVHINIKNGSADYKVKVTDQENNFTETPYFVDVEIPVSKTGTYNIEITDNALPSCPPARVKIKVDKSTNPKKGKFSIKLLDE